MSGNSCWNYFDNNSNDDVIGIVVLVLLLYPDYGSCRFGACSILGNSPCPFFRPVSRESTLDKMQKHLAMIWTLGHLVYCRTWELVTGYSHFSCQHLDRIYPPYFSVRSLFWWCDDTERNSWIKVYFANFSSHFIETKFIKYHCLFLYTGRGTWPSVRTWFTPARPQRTASPCWHPLPYWMESLNWRECLKTSRKAWWTWWEITTINWR